MARKYTEIGVSFIIATPHYLPGTRWDLPRNKVIEKIKLFQRTLNQSNIPLRVYPGMEIAIHKHIHTSLNNKMLLPLASSGYFLIEAPFRDPFKKKELILNSLLDQGVKIILAHPERSSFCKDSPSHVSQFVKKGMKIQLNLGSILGKFGKKCYNTAQELINLGLVHFIGSDAHSIHKRPPLTQNDWHNLKLLLGEKTLELLCIKNTIKLLHTPSHHEPERPLSGSKQ